MKKILVFLLCTFTLTYLSHGLLAYLTATNTLSFNSFIGQLLFILGGSSPTIFAFIFVFTDKDNAIKTTFKKHLFDYKHPAYIWLLVFLIPVIIGAGFQGLKILFSNYVFDSEFPLYFFFIALFSSIILGGLEEVGWRGYLQERLMGRDNLIMIAIVIGLIWGLWHVPLFFIESVSHYSFSFIPFLLGAVMFSTYLTWLYAKTKSILLVVLLHATINASATIGLRLVFDNSVLTYLLITLFLVVGVVLLYHHQKTQEE